MSECRWDEDNFKKNAQLEAVLRQIPAENWTEEHLIAASRSDLSAVSLKRLIIQGVNVNPAVDYPPIFIAAASAQPLITGLLIAGGANLTGRDVYGNSVMQATLFAMYFFGYSSNAAWVLVANGVRISTTPMHYTSNRGVSHIKHLVDYDTLLALEKRVDRCRSVVIAFLKVKDCARLYHWDRFLLAHLSYAVWATRTDNGW